MERIVALCFKCGEPQDITYIRPETTGLMCRHCKKGYVISPSGETQIQLSIFGGEKECKSM